ncbi:unnamed protein product [Dimorphilus gyrociliatus]|uniref:Uncharacterized protein n=1 Tax=Dimorphilus gyrociliatus TaxID=2664684 RepID=A0A7I8WBF5_9ANNE|nr:unnamed protein product [Dimorphilus gyrociliatus]
MVDLATLDEKLEEQKRIMEESNIQNRVAMEAMNMQNRAAMEARMDQLVQLVNSIKSNSPNFPSNSGDAPEMEPFPTAEEQNGGSSQVRNILNLIQETESSKRYDPRIESLKHKKVTTIC